MHIVQIPAQHILIQPLYFPTLQLLHMTSVLNTADQSFFSAGSAQVTAHEEALGADIQALSLQCSAEATVCEGPHSLFGVFLENYNSGFKRGLENFTTKF